MLDQETLKSIQKVYKPHEPEKVKLVVPNAQGNLMEVLIDRIPESSRKAAAEQEAITPDSFVGRINQRLRSRSRFA